MNPLVTVAIPTYQRLDYLVEAVTSALSQTHVHLEVLVSQDPTPVGLDQEIRAWCCLTAREEPRFRYRYNSSNLGLAGNWNALVDAARGEYLTIIGDDDRLLPNFTEKLLAALKPGDSIAFSNHYLIDQQGTRLLEESYQATESYQRHRLQLGEVVRPEIWVWQNAIPMSASLIRVKDVRRLRFKEDLNTPEIELFIRLAQEGSRFCFEPAYLSEYRLHSQSATGAGLRTEKLVSYLTKILVSPDVQMYKRQLLSQLLPNAISRHLQQGNIWEAKQLLLSEYCSMRYRMSFAGTVQFLCTMMPENLGTNVYRSIHWFKRVASRSGRVSQPCA